MEHNMSNETVKIERGPYETKKRALAVAGKIFRHEGEVYRALDVTAQFSPSFDDMWWSHVTARLATESERRTIRLAELRKELERCRMAWSEDPYDTAAAENRAEVARLRSEIDALEAEQAKGE